MTDVVIAAPPFPAGREAPMLVSVGARGMPGRVAGVTGVAVGLAVTLAACTPASPAGSAAARGSRPAAGTTGQPPGYLMYRAYLPAAGGGLSAVPAPALTVEQGGSARTLPACPSHNAPVPRPAVSGTAASAGAGGSGPAAPPPRQ